MSLGDDIRVTEVQLGLKGANAEQVYKNLSLKLSKDLKLPSILIHSELERISAEKPGIGDGIAVFDWMSKSVAEPYVLLGRFEDAVAIPSVDDRLVDFVLVLISPESQSITHLRHLSRLTRLLRDRNLMEQLRSTNNEEAVRCILSPENREIMAA